jgi:hypothetical protein
MDALPSGETMFPATAPADLTEVVRRFMHTGHSMLGGGRKSDAFGGRFAEAMGREYISFGGLETGQQISTGRAEPGSTSHAPL